MYSDSELLFPPYAISHLKDLRGPTWRKMVERVAALEEDHPESLAFSLMMMRLDGCITCETDSYKAMRGCVACALQNVRRFKGTDRDLLQRYNVALKEITAYVASQRNGQSKG